MSESDFHNHDKDIRYNKRAIRHGWEGREMDDSGIIALYNQRNEAAISETASKYSRYCRSISFNILHSDEDADECVNDTFLKAWNAIPPACPNNLAVYLGTITRRLSLNRYAKSKTQKRGSGQIELALSELEDVVSGTAGSVDEHIDGEIIAATINRFLDSLPHKQRIVFVRRYWHLRSIEEIANDYALSAQNVKQILFRARKKLRKELEKEEIVI